MCGDFRILLGVKLQYRVFGFVSMQVSVGLGRPFLWRGGKWSEVGRESEVRIMAIIFR
jgi:hypothetical protein